MPVDAGAAPAAASLQPPASRRRTRAAGFAAVMLPGALAGLLLVQWLGLRHEADVREAVLVAQRLAAGLEAEFARTEAVLRVLAASPAFAQENWGALHGQAKEVSALVLGNNVVVYDTRGHQRMNTLVPAGTPLPDRVATPPALIAGFGRADATLSDLFVGPVTGTALVAFGLPVARDGGSAFGIGVGISPDQIRRVLESAGLPDGWVAAAVDRSGTTAARTRDPARFVGRRAPAQLLEAAKTRAEGSLGTTTDEGADEWLAFRRIERLGWTVTAAAPRSQLDASRGPAAWVWGAAIVLACALGLAVLAMADRPAP